MPHRFDVSPIFIRPKGEGQISVEVGSPEVESPKPKERPTRPNPKPKERPTRPNPFPPVGLRLKLRGETVGSLQRAGGGVDPAEEAGALKEWIRSHDAADKLIVEIAARSVTIDQLGPLLETGRHLRMPIDVHLEEDD